jgi:SAM-dependent methyltransferase
MSNSRERLVYLYLKDKTSVFAERLRLLHIAPEPHLTATLRNLGRIDYVTGDLSEPRVDVKLDVMMLPFPDDSFDLVICNHVLEHVANDRVAMSELHRVLRPGRPALLQVPIGMALEDTLEDPSAVTEAERIRLFGQRDHVRLYAAGDYMRRLEGVGFRVSMAPAVECLGEEAVARYALLRDEPVFVCRSSGKVEVD